MFFLAILYHVHALKYSHRLQNPLKYTVECGRNVTKLSFYIALHPFPLPPKKLVLSKSACRRHMKLVETKYLVQGHRHIGTSEARTHDLAFRSPATVGGLGKEPTQASFQIFTLMIVFCWMP